MQGFKIRIINQEHNTYVQKVLFSIGYRWRSTNQSVLINKEASWIIAGVYWEDKMMFCENLQLGENLHHIPEKRIEEVLACTKSG